MEHSTVARKVFIEVDFVVIGLVIPVHRADLGESSKQLRLGLT